METPTPKPSRITKIFRRTLFVLAALITVAALFFAEEDWRGSRAWSNYKREMEAKGESFDPARLIPPKVPDDQNLAMIPYFIGDKTKAGPMTGQENQFKWPENSQHPSAWPYGLAADLTEWAEAFQGPNADPVQAASTVLDYLNKREPVLPELESASQRRYCRFSIDYENWSNNTNVQVATLGQYVKIKQLYRVLSLRAEAELVSGRSDQALADINLLFRVNDGLRDEPLLISQLVAYASAEVLLQPLAEGLAEHRWSDAQLRVLQQRLQQTDLLASTIRALHGELAICANPFFNRFAITPRGWDRLEQLNCNRAYQDMVVLRIDLAARRIDPGVSHSCDLALEKISSGSGLADALIRHRVMARMLLPAFSKAAIKTAATQTDVDEVMVACALERYRLAKGNYPDTLDALVPRFAAALPHDIINGQPLKYRRKENGNFILYSVGWNEKDDGGTIATNKNGHQDKLRGDWVFAYPN